MFFAHRLRPVEHKSKEGQRYPERVEWERSVGGFVDVTTRAFLSK